MLSDVTIEKNHSRISTRDKKLWNQIFFSLKGFYCNFLLLHPPVPYIQCMVIHFTRILFIKGIFSFLIIFTHLLLLGRLRWSCLHSLLIVNYAPYIFLASSSSEQSLLLKNIGNRFLSSVDHANVINYNLCKCGACWKPFSHFFSPSSASWISEIKNWRKHRGDDICSTTPFLSSDQRLFRCRLTGMASGKAQWGVELRISLSLLLPFRLPYLN